MIASSLRAATAAPAIRRVVPALLAALLLGCLAAPAARAAAAPATVVLKLRSPGGLEAFARAVSDPGSPRYRGYLTVEQLQRRFGAAPRAKARATRWLRAHGLRASVAPSGTFVLARGAAATVRAAFATGAASAATSGGRLPVPAALRGAVAEAELVGAARGSAAAAARRPAKRRNVPDYDPNDPYHGLPSDRGSAFERTGTPKGCTAGTARGFAPNQVHAAYGFDALHRQGLRGEGMRVAVVEVDGFRREDVRTFADCFGARMPTIRARTVGERSNATDGIETPLDLEVLVTAAPRLSHVDVYTANPNQQNVSTALLKATTLAIGTRGRHPDAISMSLGECEAAYGLLEFGGPLTALDALNDLFALAAASGISVLVSAGDNGSAGCTRTASTAVPLASFPSTSPWVTSVGGTNLQLTSANAIQREVVWNDTPLNVRIVRGRGLSLGDVDPNELASAGGGGRSLLFDRPWWQQAPGLAGAPRVVPDVAALADPLPGYAYYCTTDECQLKLGTRGWATIGGTSAAAPLMTAAVLLMDQHARREGQPPLGFLNPLLYSLANGSLRAAVFHDVTVGGNDVTAAMPNSSLGNFGMPLGIYPAARGYDMASGWGSPKLPALDRAALRAAGG